MKTPTFLLALLVIVPTFALADSSSTREKIFQAIDANSNFGSYDIAVTARLNEVLLEGTVASEADKAFVEQTARQQRGVENVRNYLQVVPSTKKTTVVLEKPIDVPPTDEELSNRMRKALETNGISTENVRVNAQSGKITFGGDFHNHREIDRILSVALMVPGVKELRSEMTIKGSAYRGNS